MNKEKLSKIIRLHALWVDAAPGGVKADLRWANLSNANLRGVDLRGVDLRGVDLSNANLSNANLSNANLSNANLRWANLRGVDLSKANLRGVDLSNANLSNANLDYSAWPLHCGSLGVKCDQRLVAQLAYHLASLKPEGVKGWGTLRKALKPIANRFHRTELPRIK